jgi:hypothetical protein
VARFAAGLRWCVPVADILADCTDAWTEPKPEWRPRKEAESDAGKVLQRLIKRRTGK